MFGTQLLVAPIMYYRDRQRKVYLPKGNNWIDINTEKIYEGGQFITIDAPLDNIPVFCKEGSYIKNLLV